MHLALRLAARAVGDTSPNPVVGAVVVKGGRVVGQGYHRRAGLPHAEVIALRQAGRRARGATLYTTLEPCNHVGRTPPCCEAILRAGVRRVVVAMKDPNPITNGRGLARLRRAGVRVTAGVLEAEAQALNRPFTKYITTGRPWVIAKAAQSLDGKIATRTGESRWISSEASRRVAHRLRREADAVLVGVNTVIQDDPLLTVRAAGRRPRPGYPIKVIVDSRLRTPLASRCLSNASSAPTIIATVKPSRTRRAQFERRGVKILVLPANGHGRTRRGRVPLAALLRELVARYQVTSVLIEGGGEVLAGALEERLVDRVVWSVAPIIIGGRMSPPAVGGEGVRRLADAVRLRDLSVRREGGDLLVVAAVAYPPHRKRV